jgi:hypothetical protein
MLANEIISDWVLSEDQTIRLDALVLIDQFRLKTSLTNLEKLRDHLSSSVPGTDLDELAKVKKSIATLWGDLGNVVG